MAKDSRRPQLDANDLRDTGRRLLAEFIEIEQQALINDIGLYLFKFRVSTPDGMKAAAQEVLQKTVATALRILDRYDINRPIGAWLRGIAVKEIQHLLREQRRERSRLVLVGDSEPVRRSISNKKIKELSEAEMFDLLSPPAERRTSQTRTVDELLALVGEADREILRLRHVEGLTGIELAARLGTSEGATYQRLSRARRQLRQALKNENESSGRQL